MNPYPLDTVNLGQFLEQFGESTATVKVQSVECRVLSYDYKFLHTIVSKP